MSEATAKPSRIMEILEKETHGHSYKSHKYSLDGAERSAVEYGETRDIKNYVPLCNLSQDVSGEQLLTYLTEQYVRSHYL